MFVCTGQHRGLGTMVSKVQSLKLDTSVWSNEIVQVRQKPELEPDLEPELAPLTCSLF